MIDRERAAEMRRDGMTLQAIADEFGVTRERIRQILNTEGEQKTLRHGH